MAIRKQTKKSSSRTVRLDTEDLKKLEALAESQDRSVSYLLRKLVKEGLARDKSQ
jgi:predicted transcriptional regulator